jgi:hypothetical protein
LFVIQALRRLRKEDLEFKDSLGYIVRPCLQRKKKKKERNENKSGSYGISVCLTFSTAFHPVLKRKAPWALVTCQQIWQ